MFNAISVFTMVKMVMMSAAKVCKHNLFVFLHHLIALNSIASILRSSMRRDGLNIKAYLKLKSKCSSTDKRKPLLISFFARPMMS